MRNNISLKMSIYYNTNCDYTVAPNGEIQMINQQIEKSSKITKRSTADLTVVCRKGKARTGPLADGRSCAAETNRLMPPNPHRLQTMQL